MLFVFRQQEIHLILAESSKIMYKYGMLILAINTASKNTSIALLEEKNSSINLIKEESWLSNNDEAEQLMPKIQSLLKDSGKEASKDFSQIEKVIAVKGPGSFTGLRVGITVANTISYLNKCPLYGISTFEYFWNAVKDMELAETSALLVYAGSKGVYVNLENEEDSAEIINLLELEDYLKNKKIKNVFGEISLEQKQKIKFLNFIDINKSFGEIISSVLSSKLKEVRLINPLYIKSPSITEPKSKCYT